MSSKSMDLAVWVRLKDRFSGKLRGIIRGMNRLGSVARRLGAVAGIVAGISFAGPSHQAAAFDQNLRDIAVTSGIARTKVDAWIASERRAYEDLALLTGQFSNDVGKTAGELKQAGMDDALIAALMPSISKSAKAASADMSDMGKVAFALSKNLEIPADRMQDALGKLVVAGKEGRFELKEMAQYFPALTAQLVGLGVKGEEAVTMLASGLQIAILGASDPAQAANNFQNFLQKILAPDTVKRFAKNGVDILAVMQDAATKGINPIEAVIAKTEDLTGVSAKAISKLMNKAKANGLEGEEALKAVHEQLKRIGAAGKLAELFGDQQVKAFLLPFLANIDEYKRIKKAVEAGDRTIIDKDAAIQMDGATTQLKIFKELGIQSARDVGDAFNSWLPLINGHLLDLRKYLQGLEGDIPGVKEKILAFGTGAVIAATGLGVLGFALPLVAAGIKLVAAAFALAFSPVGIVIALLVAGAWLIMKNWDVIGPYFSRLWETIQRGAEIAVDGVMQVWGGLKSLFISFMDGFAPEFDLSSLTIDNAKTAALALFADAMDRLKRAWEGLKSFGSGFGSGFMKELGPALEPLSRLAAPFQGMMENLGSILGFFKPIGDAIGILVSALAGVEVKNEGARALGEILGQFTGNALGVAASTIEVLAKGINLMMEGIDQLLNFMSGKPVDWKVLVGTGSDLLESIRGWIDQIVKTVGDLIGMDLKIDWSLMANMLDKAIEDIKAAVLALVDWFKGLPGRIIDAIGSIDLSSVFSWPTPPAWVSWIMGSPTAQKPSVAKPNQEIENNAAKANAGAKWPTIPSGTNNVQVGGQITIKVDGPGKVTAAKSTNPKVPINSGRTTGRI